MMPVFPNVNESNGKSKDESHIVQKVVERVILNSL